jgi:hypothetical protein
VIELSPISLIMLFLSTWRISYLLVKESGPFGIIDKIRYLIGVRYNEANIAYGKNVFADLLTCVWCTSVWIAALLVLLMVLCKDAALIIIAIFSTSAAAMVLDKHFTEEKNG